MIRALIILLLLSPASPAWTASAPPDDPWYEVEVIVFEHAGSQAGGEAVGRRDGAAVLPALPEAIGLGPAPGVFEDDGGEAHDTPVHRSGIPAFQTLNDAEHRLASSMNRLMVSQEYVPLLHVAWRQPATTEQGFPGVRIGNAPDAVGNEVGSLGASSDPLGVPGPGPMFAVDTGDQARASTLEGMVRLSRSRFLHLNVDLRYRKPGARTEAGVFSIFNRDRPTTEVFRLQQAKRVRSGELQYFDHPRFGAIVLITPFDAAAHESEQE